ncbi:MAG: hypothetical protein E6J01_00700 [Chloroflexi bacterium]|nr:MAG: hypothetical protein E6J01_00700 [Chloroflexota bacterium]
MTTRAAGDPGAGIETAIRRAVDPSRLLTGEDPATQQPDEARRWLELYAELLTVVAPILESLRSTMVGMSAQAVEELNDTELVLLERQVSRLRARLQYWGHRSQELAETISRRPSA